MSGHFHSVQFYSDSHELCRIVGAFLGTGLAQREPAIILAVPEHVAPIENYLGGAGFDISALRRSGDLTVLDADDALAGFMVDGFPNTAAFQHTVGTTIRQISIENGNRPIRAYGELVNVLWKDGLEAAAIRLETLWNELANTHDFKLLCGYSMGNFYKGAALEEIKHQHSHVTSATGEHAPMQ